MKVLAVSARYPTALQTWFINFLEAVESQMECPVILSLENGDSNYHPKVDQIGSQNVFLYRENFFGDFFRSIKFVVCSRKLGLVARTVLKLRKQGCTLKEILQGLRGLHLFPSFDIDIVHCHSEKAAFGALPLLLLLKKPVVLTFHGLPPEGVPDIPLRQREILANNLDMLFVNTEFASNQYSKLVEHTLPIRLIKQCINLDDFRFSPRTFPGKNKAVKVLTVGRIDRLKGHRLVVDAIARLSELGYEFTYTIVGAGYDEPTLRSYIFNLGLDHRVSIEPPAMGTNLLQYFSSLDLFVLPSFTENGQWAETQGIVVQEAQACGLPVIASDSGGIPECVRDGEDALLFKQGSAESLAQQLERLVGSKVLWEHLVTNARKNVEAAYSLNLMGKALIEAYESVSKSFDADRN